MEQTKENKMGTMPINRLLISMSLPMMISMLVQALYNVVDSIFVSRINENALTAVSLGVYFSFFMDSATTAASAMECSFASKLSERDVRMTGAAVPVRMFPFLTSQRCVSTL